MCITHCNFPFHLGSVHSTFWFLLGLGLVVGYLGVLVTGRFLGRDGWFGREIDVPSILYH